MISLILTLISIVGVFFQSSSAQADEWSFQRVERAVSQSDTAESFHNIIYYQYPLPGASGLVHVGMVTQEGKLFRGRDYWMAVTDNRGQVIWNYAWGDSGDQVAKFVELTYDSTGNHDGYIFAGYNWEKGTKFGKMMAVSMSKTGKFRWMVDYSSNHWSSFRSSRRVNWNKYELFGSIQDAEGLWHAVKIVIDKNGNALNREEEYWGNR